MDMERLKAETDVETYQSSGPGGQHKNARATAVRLTHRPTGLTATSTRHRSLEQNREAAFATLLERIEEAQRPVKPRKPTKKTYGAKQRTLAEKAKRSKLKAARRRPDTD